MNTLHRPIRQLPGPIVDTMGAGDATLAQVTSTIHRRGLPETAEDADELLKEAMLVAAATCRHPGALLRRPT